MMKMNRIINANTRCGRIANPTERETSLPKAIVWRQASARNSPAQSDLQSDCTDYKHLQCLNK